MKDTRDYVTLGEQAGGPIPRGSTRPTSGATLDAATGELLRLEMTPLRLRRFQLTRPSQADVRWLQRPLHRESEKLGSAVALAADDRLVLRF